MADDRPDAFARLVDELLASPQYGERWGRHWLDLARYADTARDNSDYPIPQAYHYRDYVIDAFNADLPYDRFLHEQIAGDILAPRASEISKAGRRDRVRAPRLSGSARPSWSISTRSSRTRVEHDGQVVLGLSAPLCPMPRPQVRPDLVARLLRPLRVLRRHQVSVRRLGGSSAADEVRPAAALPDQVQAHQTKRAAELAQVKADLERDEKASESGLKLAELEQSIAQTEEQLKGVEEAEKPDLEARLKGFKTEQTAARDKLKKEFKVRRDELTRREQDPLAGIPTAYAVYELKPVNVALQKGGNPHSPGPVVPRGIRGS